MADDRRGEAEGQDNAGSGASGFDNAVLDTIPLALIGGPVGVPAGAQLNIDVRARRTCAGVGPNSLWDRDVEVVSLQP